MKHTRVAVLRGGPSEEYDVSMQTGANVLKALNEIGYQVKDVVITRKGEWLENGLVRKPEYILASIDVVFIALHGAYGEDGNLQKLLEIYGLPYTGSTNLTSRIAFNKILTKNTLKQAGIKQPKHVKITQADLARIAVITEQINTELGQELFVKPICGGSSVGVGYAANESKFIELLEALLKQHDSVMVEEFIRGKEATVAVLEGYRQQTEYILPVVEIVPPPEDPFFSYENKYNGLTNEICPGRFSYHQKSKLEFSFGFYCNW
jgi:D-alanine-D-alanine ligase